MRNFIAVVLVLVLLAAACAAGDLPDAPSASVQALSRRAEKFAASHKDAVVVLSDGRKTSGRVVDTSASGFVLLESKTGQKRALSYDQVSEVKRKGMHPAAKIAIVVGGALLGTGIVIASQMD